MLVLGIESSCDETALALVKDSRKVITSLVASQVDIHTQFGGIIPEIAAREHQRAIGPLYKKLLKDSEIKSAEIGLIAVTQGPGLIGALLVGTTFAQGLALSLKKPIIPVDHVHAHVHGALLGLTVDDDQVFPCLSLVVSGGHTILFYMEDPNTFKMVATTQDDACGECFDKVGKMLGLPYPAGPIIEKIAKEGDKNKFAMPKMMAKGMQKNFSYSGLKTHMLYLLKSFDNITEETKSHLCASFQEAAFEQIMRKIKSALKQHTEVKSVIVAGGVSANQRFRQLCQEKIPVPVHCPPLKYCSDNAAMVAAYGLSLYNKNRHNAQNLSPKTWKAYSRYSSTN